MNNDSTVVGCPQPCAEKTSQIKGSSMPSAYRGMVTQGTDRQMHIPAYSGTLRSQLGRLQLSRPRTSEEMRKLAEQVWRQRGLALIDPLLIDDDFARQALINEANRLYGRNPLAAAITAQPEGV